jgi:hypothetical protein
VLKRANQNGVGQVIEVDAALHTQATVLHERGRPKVLQKPVELELRAGMNHGTNLSDGPGQSLKRHSFFPNHLGDELTNQSRRLEKTDSCSFSGITNHLDRDECLLNQLSK